MKGDQMAGAVPQPTLTHFASVTVEVGEALDLGQTIDGRRRVVPIRGGSVAGNGWSGRVLDAGADFQLYPSADTAYLTATYVIETGDGTRLFVDNKALRAGRPEDLARMVSGGTVDPSLVYFRCAPRITAAMDSAFAWVNSRLFIGSGVRTPDSVRLEFFAVD
jgi:hypothetical protein